MGTRKREGERPFLILSLKISWWHSMTTTFPGLVATLSLTIPKWPRQSLLYNDLVGLCKLSSLLNPFWFILNQTLLNDLLVLAVGWLYPFPNLPFQRWLQFYSFMHLSPDSFRTMKFLSVFEPVAIINQMFTGLNIASLSDILSWGLD